LAIVSATAGSNAADAAKSYDDNETTSWTNASVVRTDVDADGFPIRHAEPDNRPVEASLAGAWIEYTLAKPVIPTALDLKLASFRLRRYPLRVSLDGVVVYEGLTPISLGYVTLPLSAKKPGTKLRIELNGVPIDVEETKALVEVSGKIDQAEPKGKQAKPVLSILEAEVYTSK
jgi:beta-galactosidase